VEEELIFAQAIVLSSPGERASYLDQACAGNSELRARLERLVQAHLQPDPFLESPPADLAAAAASGIVEESVGTEIGPYKLMEQIGEGGMGVIYVAEQREPVRRKVALKVIKPGMDTKRVIARFEAERQALAMMDHPNIAKVFEAGATESGRPYFVMELVRGVPITEYCDAERLSIRERLELFVLVCRAVQHAHQKGIIHRDL
jgi:eukaryotic-like serine/threonine-protein kinase